MKRGEGLSLQTVTIAAIALIVLIIVIAVFRGGIDKVLPTLNKANECKDNPADLDDGCMEAGKCTAGTEVYGLGCDKKDLDQNKNPKTPYCCVVKRQNA